MRKIIGTATIMVALVAPLAAHAQEAEVTANAGWLSQYYYRGILQKTSSASAGLDVAANGLYLGTWAADVGDGAEIDLYGGFEVDVDDLSLSLGGTGYFYTGDFDETYLEANLGAGYGPLSVEFSIGQYDSPPEGGSTGDKSDYWFLGITAEHEGFFGTFGTFGSDFEGSYGEAGYGFSGADFDFTISGILSDEHLSSQTDANDMDTEELTLVFGVSRTFGLN